MVKTPTNAATTAAPTAPTPPARRKVDWEAIEPHYRSGIRSLKDIGAEFGVSAPAIVKHAEKSGWARDLTAKIQARADAKVNAAVVNGEVNVKAKILEKAVVEANADMQAGVRLSQRSDIKRARNVVNNLMGELEHQAGVENAILLAELGELMRRPDDKGQDKLNDLYQKIISLPGRAKTMKDLGESMRVLIGLERQAYGLDAEAPPEKDAFTTMLHRITSGNTSAFKPVADDPEMDE